MRKNPTKKIERYRVTAGPLASSKNYGANGAFMIEYPGAMLAVIVSDGTHWNECDFEGKPWEHVSVSKQARTPTWAEMDYVKRIFWRDDETVIQLHVPSSEHINHHPNCLHLWKPPYDLPLPPSETVAPKSMARLGD